MCANSVGVCVHQMNKYLPHAYILTRTKSIKELYIQEHKKNKGKPAKENRRDYIYIYIYIYTCMAIKQLLVRAFRTKKNTIDNPDL